MANGSHTMSIGSRKSCLIFSAGKGHWLFLGSGMGNLWVLLTLHIPIPTSYGLDGYGLTCCLLSCHPPTGPAFKKTCDCRLLRLQDLIMMMTQCVIIIIGAGAVLIQVVVHLWSTPQAVGCEAWGGWCASLVVSLCCPSPIIVGLLSSTHDPPCEQGLTTVVVGGGQLHCPVIVVVVVS